MGWDVCESSTFIVAFYDSVGIDEFLHVSLVLL